MKNEEKIEKQKFTDRQWYVFVVDKCHNSEENTYTHAFSDLCSPCAFYITVIEVACTHMLGTYRMQQRRAQKKLLKKSGVGTRNRRGITTKRIIWNSKVFWCSASSRNHMLDLCVIFFSSGVLQGYDGDRFYFIRSCNNYAAANAYATVCVCGLWMFWLNFDVCVRDFSIVTFRLFIRTLHTGWIFHPFARALTCMLGERWSM